MVPNERFDAWKKCHELVLAIYTITDAFPADERYGLVSQLRRAAFSAAANIAEGSAKRGWRDFRRYLDISLARYRKLPTPYESPETSVISHKMIGRHWTTCAIMPAA